MRIAFAIVLFFISWGVTAQEKETKVLQTMKRFHALMVKDRSAVDQYIDKDLSYGHSNGWIENYKEFCEDLGGRMIYHSVKEDSISVSVKRKVARIRFVGDFDVSLDGKRNQFRLKVMEIWIKKGGGWKLYGRQAVK